MEQQRQGVLIGTNRVTRFHMEFVTAYGSVSFPDAFRSREITRNLPRSRRQGLHAVIAQTMQDTFTYSAFHALAFHAAGRAIKKIYLRWHISL